MFLFGGRTADGKWMPDLTMVPVPGRERKLPSTLFGFLDIYDSDILTVGNATQTPLPSGLELCSGVLPCALRIEGHGPSSVVQLPSGGGISCSSRSGCRRVALFHVTLQCTGAPSPDSPLRVAGAALHISETTLAGCSAHSQGGSVLGYDGAMVSVMRSRFVDSHSLQSGGAIAIAGATLDIRQSQFHNCTAQRRGGAVWASAWSASPVSSARPPVVTATTTLFEDCSASVGGALSVDGGLLEAICSKFYGSVATGRGGADVACGGSASCTLGEVATANGTAPNGGGVLMFWDGFGSRGTLMGGRRALCDEHQSFGDVVYGPCVATSFRKLAIEDAPTVLMPGIAATVRVVKKDAFGQIIRSDSASVVQVGGEWCSGTKEKGGKRT